MPQPLGLSIVHRMLARDTRRGKPGSSHEVDLDRQDLPDRVEIDTLNKPRPGDTQRRFEKLILHPRGP